MRKTATAILLLLASCTPSKTEKKVDIIIDCYDCYVEVINQTKLGDTFYKELVFSGRVQGHKDLELYRFRDGLPCILINDFYTNVPDSLVNISMYQDSMELYSVHATGITTKYCL